MASTLGTSVLLDNVSNLELYLNSSKADALTSDLAQLTKLLFEFGQNDRRYKSSNKKSRNLSDNMLVTKHFGTNELWAQLKDHSTRVISTVNQRRKERRFERNRMFNALKTLSEDKEAHPQEVSDSGDTEEEAQGDGPNHNERENDGEKWTSTEMVDFLEEQKGQKKKVQFDLSQNEEREIPNESRPETEREQEAEPKETLHLKTLDEDAEKLGEYIDRQWDAEAEAFDVENEDIMERALMLEDEENAIKAKKAEQGISEQDDEEKKQIDDDFEFLNQNIISDDAPKREQKGKENENWDALFGLPKFQNAPPPPPEPERPEGGGSDDPNCWGPTTSGQEGNGNGNGQKEEEENLSRFELEERAIRRQIELLEEENTAPRSWELQGETSNNLLTHPAAQRPRNSLLKTYLDFDYADKLKPQITDDLNQVLETLIVTKIKNGEFDDVEKKRDFAKAPKVAKRKLVEIQDTKASMGLAELYEREYMQQIEKRQEKEAGDHDFISSKDAEVEKQRERVSKMKSVLFYELDQLIRFHYEPRPAVFGDNIQVKTHTKALHMEEALPFAMAKGENMAPEQLYRKPRKLGHIKGDSEMTREDRKNKRASNKKRAKHWKNLREQRDNLRAEYDEKFDRHLERIKSLNEVRTHAMAAAKRGNIDKRKESRLNVEHDDTRYTSSKQMFAQIQKHQDNRDDGDKPNRGKRRYNDLVQRSSTRFKKRKTNERRF